jgi:hypothetical protein
LEAAVTTRQNRSSTEFLPLSAALAHVEAREGALAERLLMRALAEGVSARGYVIHFWPPYREGLESLDPELFTDYGPQAPPAQIQRDGSAVLRGWGHPHFECRVLNITVDKAELLRRWPTLKARAAKQPAPDGLLTAAQAAERLACSVKTLDAHVRAGELKYLTIGHGTRRPRKFFTASDLAAFIASRSKEDSPCPSDATRAPRSGNTTSKSKVIAFSEVQKSGPGAKRKR